MNLNNNNPHANTDTSAEAKNSLGKDLHSKRFIEAALAVMPLSISVIPWAILCGTLSIEAGLTAIQAQLMSLLVFAGAAQLSGIAIFAGGGSWLALFNSTTMISVRHVLYSATYKKYIAPLPIYKRIIFAFLLTDEMFVVAQADQLKTGRFDYYYAVIAGFVFYLVWNLATLLGIFSAQLFNNIDELGLDFAIAATFIAMVVPMINNKILAIAVIVSAASSFLFEYLQLPNSLVFSALVGMTVAAILSTFDERTSATVALISDSQEQYGKAKTNDTKVINTLQAKSDTSTQDCNSEDKP